MDYNRPPSVTSGGNEIRIRGKRHDFCLSHKSDSEAVSGSAAAAPARNGSAARECLVRLTVRTETPCIRLLRSLTSSSSSLQGIVQASMPSAIASFVSSHSGVRSAAATRVLHLTVMGSLSDGGCTDAPGMLAGIGFRRSSSITILALRKPDAHRRCSATPDGSPRHTRCLR